MVNDGVKITCPKKSIFISSFDFDDEMVRHVAELIYKKVKTCLNTNNGFRNEINVCYNNESSLIKDIDAQRDFMSNYTLNEHDLQEILNKEKNYACNKNEQKIISNCSKYANAKSFFKEFYDLENKFSNEKLDNDDYNNYSNSSTKNDSNFIDSQKNSH